MKLVVLLPDEHGRIKGGQLPRAPRCKGAPVMKFICFKENTRWKIKET